MRRRRPQVLPLFELLGDKPQPREKKQREVTAVEAVTPSPRKYRKDDDPHFTIHYRNGLSHSHWGHGSREDAEEVAAKYADRYEAIDIYTQADYFAQQYDGSPLKGLGQPRPEEKR